MRNSWTTQTLSRPLMGGGGHPMSQQDNDHLHHKYNTLTLAEARKIKGYLRHQPTRTASVLHKPRVPSDYRNLPDTCQQHHQSRGTYRTRHSINYGQLYGSSVNSNSNSGGSARVSPSDSERSSLEFSHETQNKLSDDSYSSAKSHHSEHLNSTPVKLSKNNSLSSSTSKVFQNQLGQLKRFFRQMPIRRSFMQNKDNAVGRTCDLSESISQICLNRSQSPPICPPPPGELKSMSYMETASLNYSNSIYSNYPNYDEFTRERNQQGALSIGSDANSDTNSLWQLQSLPVACERNLTTVFEERPNLSSGQLECQKRLHPFASRRALLEPPIKFANEEQTDDSSSSVENRKPNVANLDSVESPKSNSQLDFHRQTAASFRFSYGQPLANTYENLISQRRDALPPKVPNGKRTSLSNALSTNSSALGGQVDNCDDKGYPPAASERKEASKASLCDDDVDGLDSCELGGLAFENDNDTTILSDTSTLHGEPVSQYSNKCAELGRTVESLKNKLLAKEKEMTELQLKQWSDDYLIGQLKATVTKLQRENAQLKLALQKTKNSTSTIIY